MDEPVPSRSAAAQSVIDAAERQLFRRFDDELARRLGRQQYAAELARRSGIDARRVVSVVGAERAKWRVNDLLGWGMSVGLDIFDLLPRSLEDLLSAEDRRLLPAGWRPGSGVPPHFETSPIAQLFNVAVSVALEYADRGATRLLTKGALVHELTNAHLRLGRASALIDLDVSVSGLTTLAWSEQGIVDIVVEAVDGDGIAIQVLRFQEGISAREALSATVQAITTLAAYPSDDRLLLIFADRRYAELLRQRLPAIATDEPMPRQLLSPDQAVAVLGQPRPGSSLTSVFLDSFETRDVTGELVAFAVTLK